MPYRILQDNPGFSCRIFGSTVLLTHSFDCRHIRLCGRHEAGGQGCAGRVDAQPPGDVRQQVWRQECLFLFSVIAPIATGSKE